MTINKIEESIQIAEELAKEICTGKESDSLSAQQWKKGSSALYKEIRSQEKLLQEIAFHESIDVDKELESINKRITLPAKRTNKYRLYIISSIAASFLILAGIGLATLWTQVNDVRKPVATNWISSIPETSESSLIVSANKTVKLNKNNLIVSGEKLVSHSREGKETIAIHLNTDNEFNKLSVPAGGEYQLTLEDGTTIQVNAASELLFPTHFKKYIRQVKLKGEAYFKVKTKPDSPFHMMVDKLNVQVTGTSFNVKAYEESDKIDITLVEGSVNIRRGQEVLATLIPGHKFIYCKTTDEYSTTEADIMAETGWTEGKFVFRNEKIENITQELSRWYNVEMVVNDDIKDLCYSGILSRKQPFIEILDALQLTHELDFKVHQDKKIDVIRKKN